MLIKKIEDLLIALDTAEAKSKLQQEQIDKVTAKAKEILSYLSGSRIAAPYVGSFQVLITYG